MSLHEASGISFCVDGEGIAKAMPMRASPRFMISGTTPFSMERMVRYLLVSRQAT